jgi:hypothetical protein
MALSDHVAAVRKSADIPATENSLAAPRRAAASLRFPLAGCEVEVDRSRSRTTDREARATGRERRLI